MQAQRMQTNKTHVNQNKTQKKIKEKEKRKKSLYNQSQVKCFKPAAVFVVEQLNGEIRR